MNYIYIGLRDLYLPAVAAALHLGRLSNTSAPTKEDILSLQHFRAGNEEDDGEMHYMGQDSSGHHVYVMCVKSHLYVIEQAINSLLSVYSVPLHEVQIRTCLPENPQVVGICSILTWLGLDDVRDQVALRLIRNRFPGLVVCAAVNN